MRSKSALCTWKTQPESLSWGGCRGKKQKNHLECSGAVEKISAFYILIKQPGDYTKDPVMSLLCRNAGKTEKKQNAFPSLADTNSWLEK